MRLTSLIVSLVAIPVAVLGQAQSPPSLQGTVSSQAALDKLGQGVSVAGDGAGNWYAVDSQTNKYWTLDGALKSSIAGAAPAPTAAPANPPKRAPAPTVRHPRDFSPGTGTSPNTVGHLDARWWKCKLIGKPCASCYGCKKDFWEKICCWKKYFCFIPIAWSPHGPGWGHHRRDALPQAPAPDGGPGSGPGSPDGGAAGGGGGVVTGGGAGGGPAPPPGGGPAPGPGGPAPGPGGPAPGPGGPGPVGPGPLPGGGCWQGVCDPYGWYYQHGTCQIWK